MLSERKAREVERCTSSVALDPETLTRSDLNSIVNEGHAVILPTNIGVTPVRPHISGCRVTAIIKR